MSITVRKFSFALVLTMAMASVAAAEPAARPQTADAAPQKVDARATREVAQFKSQVSGIAGELNTVYVGFNDLGGAFAQEAQLLRNAVANYRRNPSSESRRLVQQSAEESIGRIQRRTEALVRDREKVAVRILDVASAARAQAVNYRAKAERLAKDLASRSEQLKALRSDNGVLKAKYGESSSSQLRRELRRAFAAEKVLELSMRRDVRRSALFKNVAGRLEAASTSVQSLFDRVDGAFQTLDLVLAQCSETRVVITDLMKIEDELGAVLGGQDLAELAATVREMGTKSHSLGAAVDEALSVALSTDFEPGTEVDFGSDDEFEAWLAPSRGGTRAPLVSAPRDSIK